MNRGFVQIHEGVCAKPRSFRETLLIFPLFSLYIGKDFHFHRAFMVI